MKVSLTTLLLIFAFNLSFAGWQGAKMLRGPDSTAQFQILLALESDNLGSPWAIWRRWSSGSNGYLEFSKWNGLGWEEPRRTPDTIGWEITGYAHLTFDQNNNLFFIWPAHDNQNRCDILSARYFPLSDSWELPKQVNDSDATILDDFYPRISFGGGEIWATWFNEVDASGISDIKASRWNPELQEWEPEMTVNPDSGGINRIDWFPDVAVDTTGTPHIVWIQATSQYSRIRYSRYENGRWIEPIFITNPDSVIPTGPYGGVRPKLVADNQNILHCVFPGYRPPTFPDSLIRVYYTENSISGWKTPAPFDTFSLPELNVWECDIAVKRPDNIWVAWDRSINSPTDSWQILVSHFDGSRWSPEQRIDDGFSYYGGFPKIALDANGYPFVLWVADTAGFHGYEAVFYNHYVSNAIAENKMNIRLCQFVSPFNRIEIKYSLPQKDRVRVKIYDRSGRLISILIDKTQESGEYTLTLNKRISQGVYFIHLETSNQTYRAKTVIVR